jgi:hypothetical protein
MNQNLLYLVFKCRINTKRSGAAWANRKAKILHTDGRPENRQAKQAICGLSPHIPRVSRVVHRVVHRGDRSSAAEKQLQRCDSAVSVQ